MLGPWHFQSASALPGLRRLRVPGRALVHATDGRSEGRWGTWPAGRPREVCVPGDSTGGVTPPADTNGDTNRSERRRITAGRQNRLLASVWALVLVSDSVQPASRQKVRGSNPLGSTDSSKTAGQVGFRNPSDLFPCLQQRGQKVEPVEVCITVTCGSAIGELLGAGQKRFATQWHRACSSERRSLVQQRVQQRHRRDSSRGGLAARGEMASSGRT